MLNSNTARLIQTHITAALIESNIQFDGDRLTDEINYFIGRPSNGMVNIIANILAGLIWDTATVDQINLLVPEISGRVNRARLALGY